MDTDNVADGTITFAIITSDCKLNIHCGEALCSDGNGKLCLLTQKYRGKLPIVAHAAQDLKYEAPTSKGLGRTILVRYWNFKAFTIKVPS